MAWARVDDGWWCHPKVMRLSLAARGLWASALSWSCHQRYDTVPDRFLLMVEADPELAGELVDAGLWEPVEGGWRIHDWEQYQELSLSEKRAQSGRKGARKRWKEPENGNSQNRDATPSENGKRMANDGKQDLPSVANAMAGTQPGPSQPIPTQEKPLGADAPSEPRSKRKRDLLFEALVEVQGSTLDGLTKNERGKLNKARKEIADAGGTPQQVRQAAVAYPRVFPDATLTAMALANHWSRLVRHGSDSRVDGLGPDHPHFDLHPEPDPDCPTCQGVRL